MKVEFLKAAEADFDEVVDFANYVFSHDGGKTDFPSLLPKLYKKDYQMMEYHYLVKENGKIKSLVGAFPMELSVLGQTLKVFGIGTVSVHPYSRGCGYMKQLMNMALGDMKEQGFHLSCLGGKRQRYEHFGYTPCGQKLSFTLNNENIKYRLNHYVNENLIFKGVTDDIEQAYELYNKAQFKVTREKSVFLDWLRSWDFNVYFVYECNHFIGYVVVNKENTYISELVVKNDEDYIRVLATYIHNNKADFVNFELPVWEKQKIKQLTQVAEDVTLHHAYQFNVLNYEEIIAQLLHFKASYADLIDGVLSFEVLDYGMFVISVENGEVTVSKFEGECDVLLSHIEAMQLFFSPFGQHLVDDELFNHLIHSWFPAPLFMPTQDKV